jgi:hypothetical protein
MNSAITEPPLIQRRKINGFAIISLILGTTSFPLFVAIVFILADNIVEAIYSVLLFVIFFPGLSIMALVSGVMAFKKTKNSANLKGTELAIPGLVGGSLTLVGLILLWLASIYFSCS